MIIDYSTLEKELLQCRNQWFQESKKRSLELIHHFEKQVGKPYTGGQQFLNFINDDFFENLGFFVEETAELVSEYLSFSANDEKRIQIIDKRIQELQKKYQQNKFSGMLSPDSFFNDLINPKFPSSIYVRIYPDVEEEIKKNSENGDSSFEYIYFDATEEIFSLVKLLIELKLLQEVYKEISPDQEQHPKTEALTPNFKENTYPKVFKNGYGYELFRYLVQHDDENIRPAWAEKYFDLFKVEKLIKANTKKISFVRFLKEEYQVKFSEIDFRTTYNNEEVAFLKDIEKNFNKKYSVSRF